MPYDLNLGSRPKQFLGLVKFQHCLFDPTEREPRDTQIGPINSFICNNYRDIYWFVRENLKIDDEFEVNACSILNYDSLFLTTFKICPRVCTHCFGMNWILSLFKAQNLSGCGDDISWGMYLILNPKTHDCISPEMFK
jgi:hypothetical protein